MFGPQRNPGNRIAEYRSNLAGIKHLHRLRTQSEVPMRPIPNQPITLHVTTSGGIAYDSVHCWMNVDGKETTFELVPGESVWSTLEWRYVRHWYGQIPPQPNGTTLRYRIGGRVMGSDRWVFADNQARVLSEATEFAISVDGYDMPMWARDAVIYHIFLDRFYPGRRCSLEKADKPLRFFRRNAPWRDSET